MDLKDVLAISGHGGLFKFISQGRNGIIVESFVNKKRTFISSSVKVSSLGEIAIFTDSEEVSLSDVFKNIHQKENGGKAIDPKSSNEELKSYMAEILPDYDKERVYISDIRKVLTWYEILLENNLLVFDEKEESTEKEKEPSDDILKSKSLPEKGKKPGIKKTAQKPVSTSKTTPSQKAHMMTKKKTG
ncbi:MAG: DUF5606 domain-containing protein [Bacteroidales bacterium]|nr:DUF5606 domain-containing protein [Bacteroidales bacterium]